MEVQTKRFSSKLIVGMGFVLLVSTSLWSLSEAKDLARVLNQGTSFRANEREGISTVTIENAITPGFASGVAQAVTQEFPQAAVSPAFTFRYNPNLTVYERATTVPGPLFSERAMTLGRGKLNFSVGYSFIDFDELNGTSLDRLKNPGFILTRQGEPQRITLNNRPLFYHPVALSTPVIRMDLEAHVITPTVRFGVTDRWDLGIAIPIVHTSLRVKTDVINRVETPANLADPTFGGGLLYASNNDGTPNYNINPVGFLNADLSTGRNELGLRFAQTRRAPTRLAKASGNATGIGDITFRSKYHFWGDEKGGATWGLNLQLPSGQEENFHGTGDTHVATFLYLSQVLQDRFEPHLNLGIDLNTGDIDRSSFLYAVGATVLVLPNLGVMVDVLGRSEFGRLTLRLPSNGFIKNLPLDRAPNTCTPQNPCKLDNTQNLVSSFLFPETFKRNDIVDFTFGLRYALGTSGSVFFGGIIPLNNDGLRADFIPSGGVEYTF